MKQHAQQYTLRNVPPAVDRVLRQRAKESAKSFNQVALEALAAGAGQTLVPTRDLREVVGTLSRKEAERMEDGVHRQHHINPDLWRE